MRAQATSAARLSPEVPARQRLPVSLGPTSSSAWLQAHNGQRAQALHAAYRADWKPMPGLAAECGLSLSVAHVSRLIRAIETAEER